MCGINGISWDDKKTIQKMNKCTKHRGPDSTSSFSDKNVTLGHNRLAILDLSKAGEQPMSDKEGLIWIIFNGEIYNYPLLKEKLESKGYTFKSSSDTEAIIYAYKEYGENCVKYFNGMWAFAIYDMEKKKIFLSRDILGEKPLYYYHDGEKLIFSSQLKSIIESGVVKKEIDTDALAYYVSYGYVPSPMSIIKGVRKLEPSENMVYDLKSKKIRRKKYESFEKYFQTKKKMSESKVIDKIHKIIKKSVEQRLLSDVPVGSFLSGGIDSSLVTSLMRDFQPSENIHTFSIGFYGEGDETKYAQMVSEKLGTTHHVKYMDVNDALRLLEASPEYYDEPLSDSATISVMFVSEIAKKKVKVVLTGDGGDEIFGGYQHYSVFPRRNFYGNVFFPKYLFSLNYNSFNFSLNNNLFKTSRILNHLIMRTTPQRYSQYHAVFKYGEAMSLLKDKNNSEDVLNYYSKFFRFNNLTDNMFYSDIRTILGDLFLSKVDRGSMSVGLEARVPLLNPDLVKTAITIPNNLKIKNGVSKYILKKILKKKLNLNDSFFSRRKGGFGFPLNTLFTDKEFVGQYLNKESMINEYLDSKAVDKIVKQNFSGIDRGRHVQSLITLELWMRRWMR